MNFAISAAEYIVIAVDRFLNSAMQKLWEFISEKATIGPGFTMCPEEEYGGDICSLGETASADDDEPLD